MVSAAQGARIALDILRTERLEILERLRLHWEIALIHRREERTTLYNDKREELEKLFETVTDIHRQLADATHTHIQASLKLYQYKVRINSKPDKEEQYQKELKEQEQRLKEFNEGDRPYDRETDELLEKQNKELQDIETQLAKKKGKQPEEGEDTSGSELSFEDEAAEELQVTGTTPGDFPKDNTIQQEEQENPPEGDKPKKPSVKPRMEAESSSSGKFKPPKPRTYSGKGKDTKEHIFRQWRTEVTDYFDLMRIPQDKQLVTLGYFVSDAAKDFYQTKREDNGKITVEGMLDGIKKHCIPSTQGNNYWNEWNAIKQVDGNKTRRIGLVAIDIERVSRCIAEGKQGNIGEGVKLQKFLDAMHPDLRFQVEPAINKQDFEWTDVVQRAEKYDEALFQMGKYKRTGKETESNAIQPYQPHQRNQKKPYKPQNTTPQKKQWPPRRGNDRQYQQRKKDNQCYYCGRKGHGIAECRTKKYNESQKGGGRHLSSNSTQLDDNSPESVTDLMTLSLRNSKPPQMTAELSV